MNRRELLGAAGAAAFVPALTGFAATAGAGPAVAFEARLRLEPAQAGMGNHRWARVLGGEVADGMLRGQVQSGRVDWHVDPASGAVEAAAACSVLRADGMWIQIRESGLSAARLDNGFVVLRAQPGA